jgi:hypothetical protein
MEELVSGVYVSALSVLDRKFACSGIVLARA